MQAVASTVYQTVFKMPRMTGEQAELGVSEALSTSLS